MSTKEVLIAAAKRTPIGALQGVFAELRATELGGVALRAALKAAAVAPDAVDEVVMGCVLSAGLGQAPARQAALAGGLTMATPATTVNKMCGSGMKAIMLAADQIQAGGASVAVAGGIESMTGAPYLLPKVRSGYRMGHREILDHMFYDGLQSPWDGKLMGCFADQAAKHFGVTRDEQDAFARESVRRAIAAIDAGAFINEIAPVEIKKRAGSSVVAVDETPYTCDVSKIASLKAAFTPDGTVTAASSSSISDGAAAVVLVDPAYADRSGLRPIARIVAQASHAQEPEWFTTAPAGAIRKALGRAGWNLGDVDLFEVNEAFAIVTMIAMQELGIDAAKMNVNGGACALGHPIGASGARITVTLLHALRARGLRRGIASLCIGGGEATAIAIELV